MLRKKALRKQGFFYWTKLSYFIGKIMDEFDKSFQVIVQLPVSTI